MQRIVPTTPPLWLRGGCRPLHVAVAVILGAVAGATAGWNLTFALLVTLALVHHGPLLTTIVAGFVACIAVNVGVNLTTAIGSFCCEKIGLGAIIESLGHGPLVAMLGWHEYELIGGALLALVLAAPAAHALARRCTENHDEDDEAAPAPLFRPWGWSAAMLWMLAAAATMHVAAPQRVCNALLKQVSAAVGAPVTADHAHYDLFGGRLTLDGVRLRDLDEPGRVALRVDTVAAQVDPGLLLRGRLHVAEMELTGLTYDADPRASAAPKLFREPQPTTLREGGSIADVRSGDPMQPADATNFVHDWSHASVRLSALSRLITAVECTADLESGHAAVAQRLQAARRPAAEPRDPISGRSLPLVQIKTLRIAGLPSAWTLGDDARLELANLTSRPATTPRGAQLSLEVPSHRTQLTIGFRLSSTERRHEAELTCDSCPAGDLIDLQHAAAVGIEATANPTLALRGRGSVSRDRLELALACDVVGFRPTATAARFGNLDAAVWRAGIERLGGLRLDATLTGRWSEPQLQVTPAAVVDQLKHQLRSVGEHTLVKAVEAGRLPTSNGPAPVAVPLAAKTDAPNAKTNEKKTEPAPSPAAAAKSAIAEALQIAGSKKAESTNAEPAKTATPPVPLAPVAVAPVATPAAAPISKPSVNPYAVPTPASGNVTAAQALSPLVPPTPVTALPAVTLPNGAVPNHGLPSEVLPSNPLSTNVTTALGIGELRQPASVLDPSSSPGQVAEVPGKVDPFKAAVERTRPTVTNSTASRPTTIPSTNLPPTGRPIVAVPNGGNPINKPIVLSPNVGKPAANNPLGNLPSPDSSATASDDGPAVPQVGGDGAIVISDDSLPQNGQASRTSLVNKWFGNERASGDDGAQITATPNPSSDRIGQSSDRTLPPSDREVPSFEPVQTAAKPWFPRIRKFLGEELPEPEDESFVETYPPSDSFVDRAPSPPATTKKKPQPSRQSSSTRQPTVTIPEPQESLPGTPIQQEAKTPWYQKVFR